MKNWLNTIPAVNIMGPVLDAVELLHPQASYDSWYGS